MKKEIFTLEDVKKFARKQFDGCHGSHDWNHTLRVRRLCVHIGTIEKADMEVLETAAYLHDIGRSYQEKSKGRVCHAEKGAEIAERLLRKTGISQQQKSNVIHSILSHRFRGNHRPETLEAKILFDADKLDAIGAIGIGRAFQFAGEIGAKLHDPNVNLEDTEPYSMEDTGYREFQVKLSKIKDRMLTTEGSRIARQRHEFLEIFFRRFLSEWNGIEP